MVSVLFFCVDLQKLNESDQYRYNGLVWRSGEQTRHGHHTVELYRDGVSKPLCCPAAANEIGNGLSVPMSTTICRQLGYTTGRGTCIDNDPVTVVRYTHTVHTTAVNFHVFNNLWIVNIC